jgi:glucan biosynthesis protein C
MIETKTKKDLTIETLRGLAILLMVMGHVIGAHKDLGLKVDDNSGLRFFYYSLQYIRMPLFTVISGFVYAFKPVFRFPSVGKFVKGKVTRLLIPLVIVSTLFFLMQNSVPGTNSKTGLGDIWTIYLFPYAHFWYIQGMFVVFLIIAALENANALSKITTAVGITFISALVYLTDVVKTDFFGLSHVPFLLTFFLIGLILKRFYHLIFKRTTIIVTSVIFVVAAAYQISIFNTAMSDLVSNLLTIFVGCSACIILINTGIQNKRLVWLGNFSYVIYLFHVFATAASRIILNKLHVDNDLIHLVCGLALGMAFPVILKLLVPDNTWLSVGLFGDKIKKRGDLIKEPAI